MTMMSKIANAHSVHGPALGLAGTANVRTPCGARRVENLRPGDLIVTRDNGLQPVRIVWTRTVTAAEIAADPSLAPVRFKPRAVGPMMPQRDLLVAAAHRILVPGYRLADMPDTKSCLISARDIAEASDAAFFDKSVTDLVLHNVVFADHQVFAANGLPVESYLPSQKTVRELDEAVSRDIAALFAETPEADPGYPAPRYAEPAIKDYRPEFV